MGYAVLVTRERYYRSEDFWTDITIKSEKRIGGGVMGKVFQVTAVIEKGDRRKELTLARKNYQRPEETQHAFAMFQLLKAAGLKTWTTCRIAEDQLSLLMTNGNQRHIVCVSDTPQSRRAKRLAERSITLSPDTFSQLAQAMFREALRAAQAQIKLRHDAFLFLINTADQSVDFVIGDLDFHSVHHEPALSRDVIDKHNLEAVEDALLSLRDEYTPERGQHYVKFLLMLEKALQDARDSL